LSFPEIPLESIATDSLQIFTAELAVATVRGVEYAAGDSTAAALRKQSGVERENEEKESFGIMPP
jgi:hypothetical protein